MPLDVAVDAVEHRLLLVDLSGCRPARGRSPERSDQAAILSLLVLMMDHGHRFLLRAGEVFGARPEVMRLLDLRRRSIVDFVDHGVVDIDGSAGTRGCTRVMGLVCARIYPMVKAKIWELPILKICPVVVVFTNWWGKSWTKTQRQGCILRQL